MKKTLDGGETSSAAESFFFYKSDLPSKKVKSVVPHYNINPLYKTAEFEDGFSRYHGNNTKPLGNGIQIDHRPFSWCALPDFITPQSSVQQLDRALLEIVLTKKTTYQYQYNEADLRTCEIPEATELENFFCGEVLEWMRHITKIPLWNRVEISCICYSTTDHFVCHDDGLEKRIAFLYYLGPKWQESYGGSLDLYFKVWGWPGDKLTSLFPMKNRFVFFESGPNNFYQISEIIEQCTSTCITGWYYGPPLKPMERDPLPLLVLLRSPISVDIKQWVSPKYLRKACRAINRNFFEKYNCVLLKNFFRRQRFNTVCKYLGLLDDWREEGPPNRKNYLVQEGGSKIRTDCENLFLSLQFLRLIANITGLRIPISRDGCTRVEKSFWVREWHSGSYSLPIAHEQSECNSVHAILFLNCVDWKEEYGGMPTYVGTAYKNKGFKVLPTPNTLLLVKTMHGSQHSVTYLNNRVSERQVEWYQDLFGLYTSNIV